MWNLASVHLETVLVFVQDRSTVCAEHTIGSGIVLVRLEIVLILTLDRCTVSPKITLA
jgi:hypothetical protein